MEHSLKQTNEVQPAHAKLCFYNLFPSQICGKQNLHCCSFFLVNYFEPKWENIIFSPWLILSVTFSISCLRNSSISSYQEALLYAVKQDSFSCWHVLIPFFPVSLLPSISCNTSHWTYFIICFSIFAALLSASLACHDRNRIGSNCGLQFEIYSWCIFFQGPYFSLVGSAIHSPGILGTTYTHISKHFTWPAWYLNSGNGRTQQERNVSIWCCFIFHLPFPPWKMPPCC